MSTGTNKERLEQNNAKIDSLINLVKSKGAIPSKLPQLIDRSITELTAEDFGDITEIGEYAIYQCNNLISIEIPEGVVKINNNGIRDVPALSNLTLPQSLTFIGSSTFSNSLVTEILIPDNVKSVGQSCFYGCPNVEKIHIGKSANNLAMPTFNTKSNRRIITVDENNTTYDSRNNCNAIIKTSNNSLELGCSSTIIPDGIVKIVTSAFESQTLLTTITIPSSVTSMTGSSIFKDCTSLSTVIYKGQAPNIASYTFQNCNAVTLYDFSNCTSVPTLASVVSLGHASGCVIRIPASLYDTWTTATNWSALTDVVWEKVGDDFDNPELGEEERD